MYWSLFSAFIIASSAMIFVYLTGFIFINFFNNKLEGFVKLLSTYAVGLLGLILVYSMVKTGLRTINIGLLSIVFIWCFRNRHLLKLPKFPLLSILDDIKVSLLALLPVFIFQASYYFNLSDGTLHTLHGDHYAYADFINCLNLNGIESKYTDLLYYEKSNYLVPYHYAELWLAAFFSAFFKVSAIQSYFLIIIPLCVSIYLIGLLSFLDKLNLIFIAKIVVAFAMLFVCGVYLGLYDKVDFLARFWQAHNPIIGLLSQKLSIIYVFFVLAIILFIKGFESDAFIVLITIPILSISFLPGIIGGGLLYAFLNIARRKDLNTQLFNIMLLLITSFFIYLFYSYYSNDYNREVVSEDILLKKFMSGKFILSDIIQFTKNLLTSFIRPLVFYLPFTIFVYPFIKLNGRLVIMLLCFFMAGSTTSSLLYGVQDSNQFASNLYIVLNIIICASIPLAISYFNRPMYVSLLTVLVIIIASYNIVVSISKKSNTSLAKSSHSHKAIAHSLKDDISKVLVFLSPEDFNSLQKLYWWQLKNDLLPITQYTNKTVLFSIANPEYFFGTRTEHKPIDSLFFKYLIPINHKVTEKGALLEFIKQKNIKYLYCREGVPIMNEISPKIDTTIVSKEIHGALLVLK